VPAGNEEEEVKNFELCHCVQLLSTALLPVRPHCPNVRQNRRREDLNRFPPWMTGGDHQDALLLCGWKLSSRTWNPVTSSWTKQSTWLRIVQSEDWCLCLALRTCSGACWEWRRRGHCFILSVLF